MNGQDNFQNPGNYNPGPRGNNNGIIITAIICATVLIIGVIAFLMLRQSNSNPEKGNPETVAEATVDEQQSAPTAHRAPSLDDIPEGDVAPAKKTHRTGSLSNIGFTDDYSDIVCYSYLSDSDLRGLSKSELRILRNTIYARHGRKFKSKDLANYFKMFDWYVPKYDEISVNSLSDIEKHNISLIQKYE